MRAQDVMTPHVITVTPDTTVLDAAKLFVEHRISGAPVVDADGHVVGVLSEGDLLQRIEIGTDGSRRRSWLDFFTDSNAVSYVKSHALRVADVMSRDVVSVDADTSLQDIARLLESRGIKRVPVLRDYKLAGIVSRANLLQAIASSGASATTPAVSASDREIREQLMKELEGRPWAFAGRNVVVSDGVVHLWGVFRSMEAVQAVRVAAERIPGVRGVEDHTEPYPLAPGF